MIIEREECKACCNIAVLLAVTLLTYCRDSYFKIANFRSENVLFFVRDISKMTAAVVEICGEGSH